MNISAGIGAVQSQGQRQVFPNATTTYTLTARGPGGMDMRSVTVTVTNASSATSTAAVGAALPLEYRAVGEQAQDAYFDFDKSDIRSGR